MVTKLKKYQKNSINKAFCNSFVTISMYQFGDMDEKLAKQYPALNEFRIMPRTLQNPANYNVMEDTVIIQIFGEKPAIMEIKDASVALVYINFFEELWNVSRPI